MQTCFLRCSSVARKAPVTRPIQFGCGEPRGVQVAGQASTPGSLPQEVHWHALGQRLAPVPSGLLPSLAAPWRAVCCWRRRALAASGLRSPGRDAPAARLSLAALRLWSRVRAVLAARRRRANRRGSGSLEQLVAQHLEPVRVFLTVEQFRRTLALPFGMFTPRESPMVQPGSRSSTPLAR